MSRVSTRSRTRLTVFPKLRRRIRNGIRPQTLTPPPQYAYTPAARPLWWSGSPLKIKEGTSQTRSPPRLSSNHNRPRRQIHQTDQRAVRFPKPSPGPTAVELYPTTFTSARAIHPRPKAIKLERPTIQVRSPTLRRTTGVLTPRTVRERQPAMFGRSRHKTHLHMGRFSLALPPIQFLRTAARSRSWRRARAARTGRRASTTRRPTKRQSRDRTTLRRTEHSTGPTVTRLPRRLRSRSWTMRFTKATRPSR